ncbi:MAG: hypothetical protein IH859_07250 [Chloroflexi bacterium]|nr:hypothetical protein [Chloroflexota bacterium]
MQKFYVTLIAGADNRDDDLEWQERIRNASLEQIGVLQESVLAWVGWD